VSSQLEANKAVVMRVWKAFNECDLDALDEVVDEAYVEFTPYGKIDQGGPERTKQALEWMRSVFGNIQFEIEQALAEGDFVFTRAIATGTHVGEFMSVRATGRPVQFAAAVVSKVSDGKLVQDWSFIDTMAILKQIGEVSLEPRKGE